MEYNTEIAVRRKIPTYTSGEDVLVCDNENYRLTFSFDEEWAGNKTKTILFILPDGSCVSRLTENDSCEVPVLTKPGILYIGVKAGAVLKTTTPLGIPVRRSAQTMWGQSAKPIPPDLAQQIIERIDTLEDRVDGMDGNGGANIDVVAEVGQTIVVTEVDENGKPTAWEAADYQPRTHWTDQTGTVHKLNNRYIDAEWMATKEVTGGDIIVPETAKEFKAPMYWVAISGVSLVAGVAYDVYWNGELYRLTAVQKNNRVYVGNLGIFSASWEDTGEPFGIESTGSSSVIRKKTQIAETATVSIRTALYETYNKLPKEFLPDEPGTPGVSPHIGENGNWFIGETDTGVKAQGEDGKPGVSPHIGANGNWFIGETDTGVKAKGEDGEPGEPGVSPHIGANGNWFVGETDTGVKAQGEDGEPGAPGVSPHIGENGNWFVGETDTGVNAQILSDEEINSLQDAIQ